MTRRIYLSLLILCFSPIGFARTQDEIRPLEPGQTIEREIAGGESHTYQLALNAGQFMRVVVEQKGIDVAAALNSPNGVQLIETNMSNGLFGREQISHEATVSGAFRIAVRPIAAKASVGTYQLRLEVKPAATTQDKQQITAEALLREAIKLNLAGATGVEQTLAKAQQSLSLWRELADQYWEASTLNLIGSAFLNGRQFDQAIESYKQALTIRRDIKDRAGEGNTLSNLALTQRTQNHQEKAIEFYEQALVIKRELKDSAGEAISLTNLGIGFENLSRFERAIEYYSQALAVRRAVKDRLGEGSSLNNIGNSYRTMGRFEKALEYFDRALQIAREVKDRVGEGSALNNLGGANFGLSHYEKAIEYYEQALQIALEVKDRRGEGNALNNLGGASYSLSRYEKAISYFEQALVIKHELKDRGEGQTLSNLGISYQALGQFKRAVEYYEQALALNRELKNRYAEAQALANLGNAYKDQAQPEKALECYEQALSITRETKDRASEVAALNNLGAAYHDLGNYEKGIDYQRQALAVSREIKDRYSEAQALGNLGATGNNLGRYEEGIGYFEQSLAIFREVKNRAGEGVQLNGLGYASRMLGRYEPAIGYLEQALAIKREIKNRQGEADPLTNLGAVYGALGRDDKAAEYFGQALAVRRELKDRLGEASTLYEFAKVEGDRGHLAQARALIEQGLQIVETSRAGIYNPQLRISYFASAQKSQQLYVDLLMRQHQQSPTQGLSALAVEASERSHARGLLELLSEAATNIRQGVDDVLLARERTLSAQLNAQATRQMRLLGQAHTAAQESALNQAVSQLESDLERAQVEIRKASPRYAALTQPQPLKLKEIQQQLDYDTLLLEYALGKERSYVWAISKNGLNSYELPKGEVIDQNARQVYELLTARSAYRGGETVPERQTRVAQAEAKLPGAVAELSQTVIAPVAAELGKKRLVIVADGALQYIPFAMLPEPSVVSSQLSVAKNNGPRTTGNGQPLIVKHEVVSLPSASALAIQRSELAGREAAPKMLAVIADPVFDRADERLNAAVNKTNNNEAQAQSTAFNDARSIEHLAGDSGNQSGASTVRLVIPRLPYTRHEANQILALAPKDSSFSATDFRASRETVLNSNLSQYRYVHFATHGLLDSERPGLSALVFSMVNEEGKPEDGFLRANDIYNLKLPAELVVLSACQTGLGKEIKGEGLVGLTRGFMYAGAARVVVSLWNVNDRATADLMAKFYERMLKHGERPAAALRAAQVEMWKQKQWQSPYYWAAFTMQGEWR